MTTATATKPRAAVWTHASATTWDVLYDGNAYVARKVDGFWDLFVWDANTQDWADTDITAKLGRTARQHQFWKDVTLFFKDGDEREVFDRLAARAMAQDACPKCGASGDEKCQTKTGKKVKENGGFHTVRPGH